MKRILGIAFVVISSSMSATAAPVQKYGFQAYKNPEQQMTLPPNNLHLQDRLNRTANITEARFNEIIDQVMNYWYPIAKAKGVTLTVDKKWSDPTVNAFASQSGNNWMVAMFGGLARRPEVTEDGFALVVCHELGHHFGGYALKGDRWAAAEGESDFFATNACAKVIWGSSAQENINFVRKFRNSIPKKVEENCTAAWPKSPAGQAWCARASAAGFSLAHLLATLGGDPTPSFDTPDKTVVTTTNNAHPKGQCRLDTYFAGALCNKAFDLNVIPGKGHPKGQQSPEAEMEARKYSCFAADNFKLGTRPACWFKPITSGKLVRR
ncbi:MAG: hypothetical protein K2X47_05305 [Bdellovibrionales bacterium]|nr:hypothetical protein [Bdellovibrionales bacterium]